MSSNHSEADAFFELTTPPTDGITKVKFFHASNTCVVSSWDRTVSIHKLTSSQDDASYDNNYNQTAKLCEYSHEAGVLDVALSADDSTVYSVGCDYALRSFDIESGSKSMMNGNELNNENAVPSNLIGYHSLPIRCVEFNPSRSLIITGSWDKSIKLWDARIGNSNNNNNNNNNTNNTNNNSDNQTALISTHTLSDKIFSMSMQEKDGNYLIVATADRQVFIYDVRNMDTYVQKRESSLKYQTRTVLCHPNNLQYVLASIEGRVAVEYLNTSKEWQDKKYAFKCHRHAVTAQTISNDEKESKQQRVFPVNCVAFHPIYYTFATGGGDGVVNIWDGENKKRICQFPSLNTSIASVDFNSEGNIIAIARSYTWEKGDLTTIGQSSEKDTVVFRKIGDGQTKPKIKKKKV